MSLVLPAPGSPLHQLTIVARELALLRDRLADAAIVARGLADATDWQAKAATAFHERATLWAGDVSGLGCLGEQAQAEVDRACDRARFAESFAALSLPGGGR